MEQGQIECAIKKGLLVSLAWPCILSLMSALKSEKKHHLNVLILFFGYIIILPSFPSLVSVLAEKREYTNGVKIW